MAMDSLKSLYLHELRELYSAETMLARALPRLIRAAESPELKSTLKHHQQQTKEHARRLEQIFATLGEDPKGPRSKGAAAIIKAGKDLTKQDGDSAVMDASLIAAAQKVEHFEIAGYGTVRTYAAMLGDRNAAELLQQTLNEEAATDQALTELSEAVLSIAGQAPERATDIAMEADRMPGGVDMQGYTEALVDEGTSPAEPIEPAGSGAHWEDEQPEPSRDRLTGD
jgi:ferritin-like metal-binding protein YciE